MSFVAYEDFQIRFENTIPAADEERVAVLLEDACALAADVIGTDYVGDSGVPGAIIATICTAVRRAYENPDGFQGETIGDYSWRATPAAGGVGVYFTPDEARVMRRAAGRSKVGSIELEGMLPDSIEDAQLLSDAASSEPILYFDREDLP